MTIIEKAVKDNIQKYADKCILRGRDDLREDLFHDYIEKATIERDMFMPWRDIVNVEQVKRKVEYGCSNF